MRFYLNRWFAAIARRIPKRKPATSWGDGPWSETVDEGEFKVVPGPVKWTMHVVKAELNGYCDLLSLQVVVEHAKIGAEEIYQLR